MSIYMHIPKNVDVRVHYAITNTKYNIFIRAAAFQMYDSNEYKKRM